MTRRPKSQQAFDFGGPDPSGQGALFGTTTRRAGPRGCLARLEAAGIRTMSDVDAYARGQIRTDRWGREYSPSHYDVLKEFCGENAADAMLHELSILQCTPPPRR